MTRGRIPQQGTVSARSDLRAAAGKYLVWWRLAGIEGPGCGAGCQEERLQRDQDCLALRVGVEHLESPFAPDA